MTIRRWCENQTKCEEDDENTWTCTAHLIEGRALRCPYKDHEDLQKQKYTCRDMEYVEKAETNAGISNR